MSEKDYGKCSCGMKLVHCAGEVFCPEHNKPILPDENLKIGYKVTTETMRSSLVTGYGEIKYEWNEWVSPKPDCGNLAVLNSFEEGIKFVKLLDGKFFKYRLFEVHYVPGNRKNGEYILYKPSMGELFGMKTLPSNSVIAEKVKVVKEFDPDWYDLKGVWNHTKYLIEMREKEKTQA